jgi:hypothetical protein
MARTAFKFAVKTKRPQVILRPITDDIFDNAFDSFSEEPEIRGSNRIKQKFACKAMGVLRRLLTKL